MLLSCVYVLKNEVFREFIVLSLVYVMKFEMCQE